MIYHVYDVALLATFYGQRGRLTTLKEHLIEKYQLIPEDSATFVNDATDTFLLCFDAPATTDTSVIQLALNHQSEPQTAWPALRSQLEVVVDDTLLQWPIWGYSLVYQAMLPDDYEHTEPPSVALQPTLEALMPFVHRLHPPDGAVLPILAYSQLRGGQLSLHSIPRENDGVQAAIVYVALSTPDTGNQLVRQTLVGEGATLLMPDVIAHKGYHQIRQYHSGSWLDEYNHLVQTIRDHTRILLNDVSKQTEHNTRITELHESHLHLMSRIVDLDALHISLTQQDENYQLWLTEWLGDTTVLTLHHRHIQMALRDLTILRQKGEGALDSAQKALHAIKLEPTHTTVNANSSTHATAIQPKPMYLVLDFTRQKKKIQITWTNDVLDRRTSTFTPPYSGSDLELVIKALDAVQYPEHPVAGPTFGSDEQTRLTELGLWDYKHVAQKASEIVGRQLFTALTRHKKGHESLQQVREFARYTGRPIHYVLRFPQDAVELAALPWEALRDQQQAVLLSRGAREIDSCERYLSLEMAVPPRAPTNNKVRLLALSPTTNISPEDRRQEQEARLQVWEHLAKEGLVEWDELAPVTIANLDDWMRRNNHNPPDILHFYGHGLYQQGQGQLLFDAPDTAHPQDGEWVSARRLASLLGDIRLILLCACQSSMVGTTTQPGGLLTGVAPTLSLVSEVVVAMQLTTRMEAATRFSTVFYEEVTKGRSVQAAVAEARRSLYVTEADGVSWYVPTLYIRSQKQEPWYLIDQSMRRV